MKIGQTTNLTTKQSHTNTNQTSLHHDIPPTLPTYYNNKEHHLTSILTISHITNPIQITTFLSSCTTYPTFPLPQTIPPSKLPKAWHKPTHHQPHTLSQTICTIISHRAHQNTPHIYIFHVIFKVHENVLFK